MVARDAKVIEKIGCYDLGAARREAAGYAAVQRRRDYVAPDALRIESLDGAWLLKSLGGMS
jgi:hypothetical protein